MLDGSQTVPEADIWFYGNTEKRFPSSEHPIVQSYVDVCLDGCLEIEGRYPLARQANFAEQFVKSPAIGSPLGSTTAFTRGGRPYVCRGHRK